MPTFIAIFITAIFLATPRLAVACTLFPDTPSDEFRAHDSVFLAHPLEMSPSPAEIESLKGSFSYQQTVTWQIDTSWKGRFKQGDTFITIRKIDSSNPCSGWDVASDYRPKIFYSSADSSPGVYYGADVKNAILQFNALREEHERTGK